MGKQQTFERPFDIVPTPLAFAMRTPSHWANVFFHPPHIRFGYYRAMQLFA